MRTKKETVAALLAHEIRDCEALEPQHYRAIKQRSIEHARALGITPEIVAKLYGSSTA